MIKFVGLVMCFLVLFTGCYTLKIEAPPKGRVILQSGVEIQPIVKRKKVFYALFGLVPLSDNSTAGIIRETGITEVSVKSYVAFEDYLITALLNTFIPTTLGVKTLEVRGE